MQVVGFIRLTGRNWDSEYQKHWHVLYKKKELLYIKLLCKKRFGAVIVAGTEGFECQKILIT